MTNNRLPSLAALRAFEAVARLGSMKEASNELHVTPGAISQLIRKLEDELSIQLFERRNREIVLTEKGRKLKNSAFDAFNLLKNAVQDLSPSRDKQYISVSCSSLIANNWLAPRIFDLAQINSEQHIKIIDASLAINNEAQQPDIAITTQPGNDNNIDYSCLGFESFAVMASPSYLRRKGTDLLGLMSQATLLKYQFNDNDEVPTWDDWYEEAGINGQHKREIDFGMAFEQALTAAKSGAGLILAPLTLVSNELTNGALISPFGPILRSNIFYWLGQSKSSKNAENIEKMKEWLMTCLLDSFALADNSDAQVISEVSYDFTNRALMSQRKLSHPFGAV